MKKIIFLLVLSGAYFQAQNIEDKEAFKKCRKEFNKKICLADEDKDNIPFYLDQCPKESGVIENHGCAWPDTDKDGTLDKDDQCLEIAGPIENNGCPWPDTDGDGILDKDDACPNIKGLPEFHGCPDPISKSCRELIEKNRAEYLQLVKDHENIGEIYNLINKDIMDIVFRLYPKMKTDSKVGISLPFIELNPNLPCGIGCNDSSKEDTFNFLIGKFWTQEAIEFIEKKYHKSIRIKGFIPSDPGRQNKLETLMGKKLFNYLLTYSNEESGNIIIPSQFQQQTEGYFNFYLGFINPYTLRIVVEDQSVIYEYKNNKWQLQKKKNP